MSTIILGCDNNNSSNKDWQITVARILEKAGYKVEQLQIGPDPFANYSYSNKAKGKIGVYIMAASLISYLDGADSNFDFCYFGIRGDVSKHGKKEGFETLGVPKDHDGNYSHPRYDECAGKTYPQLNELFENRCCATYGENAQKLGENILAALSGVSTSSNSQDKDNEDEDEEWDDKDNFTPHKGRIMEILPYKQISSISFEKSYDSPSGTGSVELLFNSKDYRYLYKGVSMKLKLRRSSDKLWSATGVEEPNYDESEKFFKEHIPTNELRKELGLPDYKKYGIQIRSNVNSNVNEYGNDGNSISNTRNTNSNTNNSVSNNNNNSNNNSNNRNNTKKRLSGSYINTLTPEQAQVLAKQSNKYDEATIKRLRRRAIGLYW